ncbi:MAG: hypothetical protein ACK5KP_09225 [Paludibacteraceae bacterium]
MKKINLLIMSLVLISITTQNVFAQDAVYNDIDRTGWVAKAPPYSPTDNAVGIDGKVAGPEYLLDTNDMTFLALVKPGKTYNGVSGPANIEDLGFTVDLGSAHKFNFFRIHFRSDNTYDFLRPWKISIYGSNGTETDPYARTWTLITDMSGNNQITLPNAEGNGLNKTTGNVEIDNTTAYTSVKVVYTGTTTSTSGSTLQLGEFYLGTVSYDKVIEKPEDVSFGDIIQGATVSKTLTVAGANLSSEITYTKGAEADAAAFTITPGAWNSTGGTATVTFAPTAKKEYNATLTINSVGALEPQTISLKGNADFDMPVQISSTDTSNEHWYYIQFVRQAATGKVLTVVNPVVGDTIKQTTLDGENANQLWKITGTWDNYKVVNKSGNALLYTYTPAGENPLTGLVVPEVNTYLTKEVADADMFGFVRYMTTDTWQLKNTTTTVAPEGKIYLNDQSGVRAGGYLLNNTGNQLKFIDASIAEIIVPGDTVKLGAVKQYAKDTLNVLIKSVKLTNGITATITKDDDQVYSLKTTSLPMEGGTLEVIFEPTAYKKVSYATITLTSGSVTKSFVVSTTSDTGNSKYYVGTSTQWGTPVDGEVVPSVPTLKANDVVWIASGEYTTGQISVPTGVSIYGGFLGTETSPEQRAVGTKAWEFTHSTVLKNSASLVLSITGANTVVDGITFEGTSVVGRAIQNTTSTATKGVIRNSIMKNFTSNADGGAMNIRYQTEVYNCLITNNTANKGGAGYLDQVTIHDCEITNNSVPTTAAKPIGNINGGGGGLLLAPEGTGCRAYNLYIAGNTASYGGGAYVRGGSKLYNSVIVENTATSGSGIVFDERDSNPTVYNVTVANNHATAAAGSGVCFTADGSDRIQNLYNSILWNNTDLYGEIYNIGVNESGAGKAKPQMKSLIIDDLAYYVGENANLAIVDGLAVTDKAELFDSEWVTAAASPGREKGFTQLTEEITDPETQVVTPATYLEFATSLDFAGKQRIVETIDIGPYEDQSNNTSIGDNLEIIDGNVIQTVFYNIHGIEMKYPASTGIYIKKEIMDNGNVRTSKIIYNAKNSK